MVHKCILLYSKLSNKIKNKKRINGKTKFNNNIISILLSYNK